MPNTFAHLKPTSWFFKQFSRTLSSTFGQCSNKKFDENHLITSQDCKNELNKYNFVDLSIFGKYIHSFATPKHMSLNQINDLP